jgi:hypothetical protein
MDLFALSKTIKPIIPVAADEWENLNNIFR